MVRPLLLRRTRRNAKWPGAFFALAFLALTPGCSDVPPAYNPLEWGQSVAREVSSWFDSSSSKPASSAPRDTVVEPPPAEGRPYPNLAMVPKPPPRDTQETRLARQRELAALQADHAAATSADTILRQEGKAPPKVAPAAFGPSPADTMPAAPPPPVTLPPAAVAAARPAMAPPAPSPAIVSPPAAAAPASTPVLTTSERRGAVAFARDGRALTDTAQRTLRDAAAVAVARSGRVRLVPAQYSRTGELPQEAEARARAMTQVLAAAGLPASRVVVAEVGGQRVDLYDVYVDY